MIPIAFLSKKTVWDQEDKGDARYFVERYIISCSEWNNELLFLYNSNCLNQVREFEVQTLNDHFDTDLNVRAYNSIQSIQSIPGVSFLSSAEDHQLYTNLVLLWNPLIRIFNKVWIYLLFKHGNGVINLRRSCHVSMGNFHVFQFFLQISTHHVQNFLITTFQFFRILTQYSISR